MSKNIFSDQETNFFTNNKPLLVRQTTLLIKELLKDANLDNLIIGEPIFTKRKSNRHTEDHSIIVIPITIKDKSIFSVFLGDHCRNRIKFEDELTGYVRALSGGKISCLTVRIDVNPQLSKEQEPIIDDASDINSVDIDEAVEKGIVQEGTTIRKFFEDKELKHVPGKLVIEHHTDLIGPSVQLAILAGYIAKDLNYKKILDLFCGAGSTTNAIMSLHESANELNIACVDKKIAISTDSLAIHRCTTIFIQEDIMKFLDDAFLKQEFEFIVADPPHTMVYDFIKKQKAKISKRCKMFLLYFSHNETQLWINYIIARLTKLFEIYKVSAGGEVMIILIPREKLDKLTNDEKRLYYYNHLRSALDHYSYHMRKVYEQNVEYEPKIP